MGERYRRFPKKCGTHSIKYLPAQYFRPNLHNSLKLKETFLIRKSGAKQYKYYRNRLHIIVQDVERERERPQYRRIQNNKGRTFKYICSTLSN